MWPPGGTRPLPPCQACNKKLGFGRSCIGGEAGTKTLLPKGRVGRGGVAGAHDASLPRREALSASPAAAFASGPPTGPEGAAREAAGEAGQGQGDGSCEPPRRRSTSCSRGPAPRRTCDDEAHPACEDAGCGGAAVKDGVPTTKDGAEAQTFNNETSRRGGVATKDSRRGGVGFSIGVGGAAIDAAGASGDTAATKDAPGPGDVSMRRS